MARKPSIVASLRSELDEVKNRYTAYLHRRSATGNFFQFFLDYLKVMSLEEAAIIQSITNLGKAKADSDGWVFCTTDQIEAKLGIKRWVQDRSIRESAKKKFIETRLIGFPPKRQIRVDLIAIEEAIDLTEEAPPICMKPTDQFVGNLQNGMYETNNIKKASTKPKKKKGGRAATPPPPVPISEGKDMLYPEEGQKQRKPPGKVHMAYAKGILQYFQQNRYNPGKYDQTKWARAIREIESRVGEERFKAVYTYLITRHKGKPTVRSVKELDAQWNWLTDLEAKSVTVSVKELSPLVQTVIQRSEEKLPRQSHASLPAAAVKTVKFLESVRDCLGDLIDRQEPKVYPNWPNKKISIGKERYYLDHVLRFLQDRLGRESMMTNIAADWFTYVALDVKGWKDWKGDLSRYVLAFDHKLFPGFWEAVLFMGEQQYAERLREDIGNG